jgi:Tol biopolymer transport system component
MTDDLKGRFAALDELPFPHEEGPPDRNSRVAEAVTEKSVSPVRRLGIAAFALLVGAVGVMVVVRSIGSSPGSQEQIAPSDGRIVFAAYSTNGWDLSMIRPDGSGEVRLPGDLPEDPFHPSWSPDGSKIAFHAGPPNDKDIYVVGVDGTELTRLTYEEGWDYQPSWSPDGSRIAYVRDTNRNPDIWVMDADGSHAMRLTSQTDFDLDPAWSPDGTQIVFQSNRTGSPEIYVMRSDGSAVEQLTDAPGFEASPVWSPDGSQIAFVSERSGPGIYVMDPSGGEVRKLIGAPQVGPLQASWSPDGQQIAFTARRTGIYVLDLRSGETATLIEPSEVCCIDWQSSGDGRA